MTDAERRWQEGRNLWIEAGASGISREREPIRWMDRLRHFKELTQHLWGLASRNQADKLESQGRIDVAPCVRSQSGGGIPSSSGTSVF